MKWNGSEAQVTQHESHTLSVGASAAEHHEGIARQLIQDVHQVNILVNREHTSTSTCAALLNLFYCTNKLNMTWKGKPQCDLVVQLQDYTSNNKYSHKTIYIHTQHIHREREGGGERERESEKEREETHDQFLNNTIKICPPPHPTPAHTHTHTNATLKATSEITF